MNKKVTFLLVCFFLFSMIVLGGCSDNTSDGETATPSVTTSAITSKGSVTVGITQSLDSLDPHKMVYAGTKEVLFNVFEGLVKPTADGDLIPAVASDYKISDDGCEYTFTLRDGILFHDNQKVTVEDIKYSIERYAEIQGSDSAFSNIKEVKIVDDTTVKVILKEGNTEFLAELTCAIIPKSNKNPEKNPIGTGPFKVKTNNPGANFEVEKFNGYWQKGVPYLDTVNFKIVANVDSALLEMQSGMIDIMQYLTVDQASTLGSSFNVEQGNVNYVQGLFLNNSYGPLKDERVRQALCYAVDKDTINQLISGGKSHMIGTNMIPAFKKYYDETTENTYTYDVEKAKSLLSEAGYADGFDLTITVPNNYAPHQTTAEAIVENLKAVGIKAKIELVEFTSWVENVYNKRQYEATVVAVDGTLAPSSWFIKNITGGTNNFTNFSDSEFDTLYKKAYSSTNDQEKIETYKKMQHILADKAASVYVQDIANLVAVNSKLTGYQFYPVAAQDMSKVGFIKE